MSPSPREGIEWAGHTADRALLPAPPVSSQMLGTAPGAKPGLGGKVWWPQWLERSQRGSGSPALAVCCFPQLCGGILPAFLSLRASLRPLAVPVSADSRGIKHESLHQHQVSAAALGPMRLDWISNWITVPASESIRGSGTQGWLSPLQETSVSAVPASLGLTS